MIEWVSAGGPPNLPMLIAETSSDLLAKLSASKSEACTAPARPGDPGAGPLVRMVGELQNSQIPQQF